MLHRNCRARTAVDLARVEACRYYDGGRADLDDLGCHAGVVDRYSAVLVSAQLWGRLRVAGRIVVGAAVTRFARALGPLRRACLPGYGRASSTMLNWFSATLRTWLYPASASTARSFDSPACEPRPRPTGWESEAGTHRNVDAA